MQRRARSALVVGGLVVATLAVLYPVVIEPLISEDKHQQYGPFPPLPRNSHD